MNSMEGFVIVAGWIFAALCIHAVAYRLLFRYRVFLFLLGLMYIPLVPYLVARHIIIPYASAYPFTLFIFSSMLGCLFVILYLPFVLEGQTPSSVILSAFRDASSLREKELLKRFSKEQLFDPRLRSLRRIGLIEKKNSRWRATFRGMIAYAMLWFGMKIAGLEDGG